MRFFPSPACGRGEGEGNPESPSHATRVANPMAAAEPAAWQYRRREGYMYRFSTPSLIVALAWTAVVRIAAAGPPPAPPQFVMTGVADGLPSNTVYRLAQDRDGFIWIGTYDGLARYDGVSFRVFRN